MLSWWPLRVMNKVGNLDDNRNVLSCSERDITLNFYINLTYSNNTVYPSKIDEIG